MRPHGFNAFPIGPSFHPVVRVWDRLSRWFTGRRGVFPNPPALRRHGGPVGFRDSVSPRAVHTRVAATKSRGGVLYCKQLDQLDAPGPGELFDTPAWRPATPRSRRRSPTSSAGAASCSRPRTGRSTSTTPASCPATASAAPARSRWSPVGWIYVLSNDSGHYQPPVTRLKQL